MILNEWHCLHACLCADGSHNIGLTTLTLRMYKHWQLEIVLHTTSRYRDWYSRIHVIVYSRYSGILGWQITPIYAWTLQRSGLFSPVTKNSHYVSRLRRLPLPTNQAKCALSTHRVLFILLLSSQSCTKFLFCLMIVRQSNYWNPDNSN